MLSSNTNIEKKLRDLGSHGTYNIRCVRYPVASGVIEEKTISYQTKRKRNEGLIFQNPFS